MKKIIIIIITLALITSCSRSSQTEPEICDLSDHRQVLDEMASSISKLKEQIHILGTESNPDFSTIYTETSDLLETTKKIQAPGCLEKSKEFAAKIDERLLASYHRIRSSSSTGLAVVGLERGAPKGSFFTIPPQKQMEIAQRKKIIIDEHSGKILVDDELVMEETEKMKSVIKF